MFIDELNRISSRYANYPVTPTLIKSVQNLKNSGNAIVIVCGCLVTGSTETYIDLWLRHYILKQNNATI